MVASSFQIKKVKSIMIKKLQSLKSNQGFMRYFKNTLWLFAEKILRMFVGLFVGIWVARYLGPEQFGLFSYAQSFVGLFTAIATLGLDGIVVRELVKDESRRDELIGTAFWLKLIGAFGVLLVLAVAVNFTSNDSYTNTLVFIIASATVFQAFNVVDMYFQAKVMGKYITYANLLSLLASSLVKIALIMSEASLEAFALTIVFDSVVLAITSIMTRFAPGIMTGAWLLSSTSVSEFIGSMERMHLTEKIVIPLSVIFRFFPTISEEYQAISDAMKMRGIRFGGKNPFLMVEYRLVPLMVSVVKIGDELSAAALTRGLGAPVKRTNVCQIGFHVQDMIAILLCALCFALFLLGQYFSFPQAFIVPPDISGWGHRQGSFCLLSAPAPRILPRLFPLR